MRNKVKKIIYILMVLCSGFLTSCTASDAKIHEKHDTEENVSTKSTDDKYEYFKDVKWINRNDKWSLSISPKDSLRWTMDGNTLMKSWEELKDDFGSDDKWPTKKREDLFFKQYRCHFFKAKLKNKWNIEPYRDSVNFICN